MQKQLISSRVFGLKPSTIRNIVRKVNQLKSKGIDVIDFSIGRPFFETPLSIKEKTKEALDNGMVHYSESIGILELRKAISQRMLIDKGIKYDVDEIVVTVGGTESMFITLQTLLSEGDEVIVPSPMYVYYQGWIEYAGAICVPVALTEGDFSLDIDAIRNSITSHTKMIILNTPHNPTGTVFSYQELKEISKLADEHDLLIVSDEIYQRIVYDGYKAISIASLPKMKERTIISDSLSKTYAMDGWRIGYIAAPREIAKHIAKVHQHIVSCHNTFIQYGAIQALTQNQEPVDKMIQNLAKNKELTINYLKEMKIPFVEPKGAFYVFPSIKQFNLCSEEFTEYLLNEAHIAVVPGSAFGNAGEGYIRISFTPYYQDIENGLKKMYMAIKKIAK